MTDFLLTKQGTTITLTFSGLDDSLTYDLNIGGGFTQAGDDGNTLYQADGQSFTSQHDDGALAWGNLNGLSTDGSSSLVITVNDAAGKTDKFAIVSALTLTAVEPFGGAIPHYPMTPIAGQSLVVDGFQTNSGTEYRFEGIDYVKGKAFTPAGLQNEGAVQREEGAAILTGNGIYYAKDRSLRPGESIHVTIIPSSGAFTGLAVGETRIDIGNYATSQHSMPLLFRTGPTEWEMKTILVAEQGKQYLRMVIGEGAEWPNGPLPYEGKPVSILINRGTGGETNKIMWQVTGAYAHGQGTYTDNSLSENAPFGLCHNAHKDFEPYATVTSFKHGVLEQDPEKLPSLRLAPWVPTLEEQRQTWDQYNVKIARATALIKTVKPSGQLTKEEIEDIKTYYKTSGYPHSNLQNSNVFAFEIWSNCTEFYRLTGDVWFLDHAARIAEQFLLVGLKSEGVLAATMDSHGLGTVERFVKMPGIFPHMRRCFYNDKKELITQDDTAQASLLKASAAFCLQVAKDQSLWGKVVPDGDPNQLGETYRERSLSYLDNLELAISNMVPYRLNEDTFVFEYPLVQGSSVVAYNRWFLSIVALPEAASALELFDVHPERIEYYDKMVQAGIENIKSSVNEVNHEEGLIWNWPYRFDNPTPPAPAEDFGHGRATLNGLRRFYESGRYQLSEEELRRFIRAYLLQCYDPKTQTFSFYTDGSVGTKGRKTDSGAKLLVFGKYFHEFDDWFLESASKDKDVLSIMAVMLRRAEKWGLEGDITHGGTTINMDFVDIDHAGNAADGSYGVVGYDYRMGTFEIKASQWASVLAADPNIGNAGSWSNSLPTASANWYEASKFANWLTTGNAYKGAYQYNSGGTLTNVLTRAQMIDLGTIFYVLPTEDEWYKAAYFKSD
ncbi:MAG: hypothetical protein V3W44_05425, partial [Dehalococcoidales bacterium]